MHATAVLSLRTDTELHNLIEYTSFQNYYAGEAGKDENGNPTQANPGLRSAPIAKMKGVANRGGNNTQIYRQVPQTRSRKASPPGRRRRRISSVTSLASIGHIYMAEEGEDWQEQTHMTPPSSPMSYGSQNAEQELSESDLPTKEHDYLEDVLVSLGIAPEGRFVDLLRDQGVVALDDLCILSKSDMQEIGFNMAQRNRLLQWSTEYNKKKKQDKSKAATALRPKSQAVRERDELNSDELSNFLVNMPIFKSEEAKMIDPDEVKKFIRRINSKLKHRMFYKNTVIISKGADANEMYFVYSGAAEVFIEEPKPATDPNGPKSIAEMTAGTCFGEAALVSPVLSKRNAWIRAKSDMVVYELLSADLIDAIKSTPQLTTLFAAKSAKEAADRNALQTKPKRSESLRHIDTGLLKDKLKEFEQAPVGVIGGLPASERLALLEADPLHGERVYVINSWVQHSLVERSLKQGLAVASPLQAQLFSRQLSGIEAFMSAQKIVDTPFPFP
jgi:CRP-like cAMP-binding protein